MGFQPARDFQGIGGMLLLAEQQRLQAEQELVSVEGA